MSKWIGVDIKRALTTAANHSGAGFGSPDLEALSELKDLVAQGRDVRILSNRSADPQERKAITEWLNANGLPAMPITGDGGVYMQRFRGCDSGQAAVEQLTDC